MQKLLILTTLLALLAAGCGTKGALLKPPPAQPTPADHSSTPTEPAP
jgi:predicted small lipoprotein YifL